MTNPNGHPLDHTHHEEIQGEGFLPTQVEAKEAPQTIEEHFLELFSLPAERAAELHKQLQEITERTLATTVNPHDQEALLITAGIVNWRLFAKPGDPLPFGLVQGRLEDGSYGITYDSRIGFGNECADAARTRLNTAGLNEIDQELETHVEKNLEEIEGIFRASVETSRALQFIITLTEGSLPRQLEERPISPYWRTIRETQIDNLVRTRWGLEPQEQIAPYTGPYYDLRNELSRLDEETSRELTKPEVNPLDRLRTYFGHLVSAEFMKDLPDEVFLGFGRDTDGDVVVRTAEDPEGRYWSEVKGWTQKAASKLSMQFNEVSPYVNLFTREWLSALMYQVVGQDGYSYDLQELHKQALDTSWENYEEEFVEWTMRLGSSEDYRLPTTPDALLHAALVLPRGPHYALSRLPEDISAKHEHYSQGEARAEINTDSDEHVGEVLRFTPDARGQHAYRLIQSEPKSDDLPPLGGDEELIIRLGGQEFQYAQPYIPGYCLVSNSHDVYGFVLDERGDPYIPADIPLSFEQRSMLADRYAELGLQQLSHLVRGNSRLTVQELASLMGETSTYISSSQAQSLRPPLPLKVSTKTLVDFDKVVRNGALQVQCTGASEFLRLSLEEVFGKGMAATTSGYKLSRYKISTSARHAQTVFTHQGHTYLLDATPSSPEGTYYNDYLFNSKSRHQLRSPALASLKLAGVRAPIAPSNELFEQPRSRDQEIQAIRNSLDIQLMGLLQATDRDALYKKINTLPLEDPFRRTVETALRATYGEASTEDIESLYRYLVAYQRADELLRQQMRVPSYDEQTIQILQNAAKQLLDL